MYSIDEAKQATLEYFDGDELATSVFIDKYDLRDEQDNLLEKTPTDMHRRMAKEIARIEKDKFQEPMTEDEIFVYFDHFKKIVPQGSIMYGLGNKYKYITLSNCYVVENPYDSYSSILKSDEEIVSISKRRGGCGIDISNLRPANTPTKNAAKYSTGIIPFMERYSNTIREVGQQNRRGALLISLNAHHPEVLNFINSKKDKTKITGANISVKFTNEFLDAVKKDEEYEQRWPVDSKNPIISQKVKARNIWNAFIKSNWQSAEPGVMFSDNIIQNSPADCYGESWKSISSNPCCISVNSDVIVITNNGLKEIKTITKEDKIWINDTKEFVNNSGYFKSGVSDIYRIEFSNGETLDLTSNHKLCKALQRRIGTKLDYFESNIGTQVSELKIGDYIMIQNTDCHKDIYRGDNTYEEGLILGWLTGDGCLTFNDDAEVYPYMALDFWKDDFDIIEPIQSSLKKLGYDYSVSKHKDWQYKRRIACYKIVKDWTEVTNDNIWLFRSHDKDIPYLYKSSVEFIKGFISAYFSADGTVSYSPINSNYTLSLSSINKKRLHQISYILGTFGIKSYICKLKDAEEKDFNDGYGPYKCSVSWRLIITGIDNIKKFANNFILYPHHKKIALQAICDLKESRKAKGAKYTKIKKIQYIGQSEVGCIDVDKYHKFTVNNIISFNSELPLCPYDSCRLILLNLYSYIIDPFKDTAKFDYDLFYSDVQITQRLIDDIVDLELEYIDRIISKINNDPEPEDIKIRELNLWKKIREKCKQGRRTGVGITALGDCLAALTLEYGSEKSLQEVDKIYKTLKFGSYRSSIDMAKEIGPFEIWNKDLEIECKFFQRFKNEELELSSNHIISGISLIEEMNTYGRRNIACLTTAPAGSVSLLTQTTSGIEPIFQLEYTRRKKISDQNSTIIPDFVDKNGDKWQNYKVIHPKLKDWMKITGKTNLAESPWIVADKINWQNRVKMQGLATQHLDHSISSTINLPNSATEDDISLIYKEAWESGCKGITVYRDGCRDGVLIKDKTDQNKKKNLEQTERPRELNCDVYHIIVNKIDYFVLVGLWEDGTPYEMFAGKNGCIGQKIEKGKIIRKRKDFYKFVSEDGDYELAPITGVMTDIEETISRLTSGLLRSGANMNFIVSQLEKIGNGKTDEIHNFGKCLARCLRKAYIFDNTPYTEEQCPDCGADLVRMGGCPTCSKGCGYSKCL
jgi:ribonucleotide reductase alpha subunit